MKDEPLVQSQSPEDEALSTAISQLVKESAPDRDLWPAIQEQLARRDTKIYNRRWLPWVIAASVLVSFTALWFSWNNLNRAEQIYALNEALVADHNPPSIESQIKAMEREYGMAKSVLIAQIAMNGTANERELLTNIKSNLLIIEQATEELKAAIIKQPNNPGLINLLNDTYRKELAVLTQLARLNQET